MKIFAQVYLVSADGPIRRFAAGLQGAWAYPKLVLQ
jgi:hypothetical protein